MHSLPILHLYQLDLSHSTSLRSVPPGTHRGLHSLHPFKGPPGCILHPYDGADARLQLLQTQELPPHYAAKTRSDPASMASSILKLCA